MDSPYLGRLVAFVITPIVVGLSAWIVPWVAENFPGAPNLDAQELSNLGVASIVAVGGVIYKWVDNKGKSERAAHPEA
jgi:hypothetical protein